MVTLRVWVEPFTLEGRELVAICDVVVGSVRFAHAGTATIRDEAGGELVVPVPAVEAARSHSDGIERTALLFLMEHGSELAVRLTRLLRPGTLVQLGGPAAEPSPDAGHAAP